MEQAARLLMEHYVNFPEMEMQDAVKFLYQHHMGPGHLVADEQAAFDRLQAEWEAVPTDPDMPLFHPLGNGLCRLNLSACKAISLSPKQLQGFFSSLPVIVPLTLPDWNAAWMPYTLCPFLRSKSQRI